MERYILAALIGIVAIASIAPLASARPGKGQRGNKMRPQMAGRMMEALDLTDAQKEKLQDLRTANAKAMAKLQADAKIAQIDLKEVMQQDNPKTADVKAKIAAVNKVRGQIMEKRALHGLEMKQVFTPEQRKKLQTLKKQHRRRGMRNFQGKRGGRHGHWRGRMMRRGGPMAPPATPPAGK